MAESMESFISLMNRFRSLNVFSTLPLSRLDYMVLLSVRCLQKHHPEGITVSMAAKDIQAAQPTISRTLRGLEALGLVQREVSREDRRNTYVTLTEKGLEAVQESDAVLNTFHTGIASRFSAAEMEQLIRLLRQLYDVSAAQLEEMKKGAKQNG